SRVAKGVHVKRWRYIDHIQTAEDTLLQVSSEIQGRLDSGWQDQIGRLFTLMLPAGSISGAPKRRTLEIIQEAEEVDRGWYTGVCGIFDGERLDSGVMIRLVAQDGPELYYHSGGGITAMSRVQSEFDEMIKKIYVPLHRNHPSQERHVSSSAFA
ncbi:MAG: chorismate-binding protein, partial [Bacteroidota bacterium]